MRGFWIGLAVGLAVGVLVATAIGTGPAVPVEPPSLRHGPKPVPGGRPSSLEPDASAAAEAEPADEGASGGEAESAPGSWRTAGALAEFLRLAGLPPDRRRDKDRNEFFSVAYSLAQAHDFRVEDDVILRLLADPDPAWRRAGARASVCASDAVIDRMVELARSETDPGLRAEILQALGMRREGDPRIVAVLIDLSRDPEVRSAGFYNLRRIQGRHAAVRERLLQAVSSSDPVERSLGLRCLGHYAYEDAELTEAVLRATTDEDLRVREAAVLALDELGDAGAGPAFDILVTGDYPEGTEEGLARLVVEAGLLLRALDAKPPPAAVRALVGALDFEHQQAHADRLAGRFEQLLAAYGASQDPWEVTLVLRLAAMAGETDLLAAVAADRGRPWPSRLATLEVALDVEDPVLTLALLRTLISADATEPAQRREVVDCAAGNLRDHPREAEIRRILEKCARDDPSPWVRLEVERFLNR